MKAVAGHENVVPAAVPGGERLLDFAVRRFHPQSVDLRHVLVSVRIHDVRFVFQAHADLQFHAHHGYLAGRLIHRPSRASSNPRLRDWAEILFPVWACCMMHRQRTKGQTGGPQRIPPAAYRESPAFPGPPLRLVPGRGTTPPTGERLRRSRRCSDDNTLAVMKRWAVRSAPDDARAPRPSPAAAPHALPTPHPALGTRAAPCYRPERRAERDDATASTRRTRP